MRFVALSLVAGTLLLCPWAAQGQVIGVYVDLASSYCQITAPEYVATTFYINAVGSGIFSPMGFQGAEFSVQHSIPQDAAVLTATANPAANLVLGDPLNGGTNIAFPECQTGFSVNLFSVVILVLDISVVTNQVLYVVEHDTPSNPNFQCPLLNKCDAPAYTTVCVFGSFGCINDQQGFCIIDAVESRSWSEVKSLFR